MAEQLVLVSLGLSFFIAAAGHFWLVYLGFRDKGVGTGFLWFLIGLFALVYAYREWRIRGAEAPTTIPLFLAVGGLSGCILLILVSSFF